MSPSRRKLFRKINELTVEISMKKNLLLLNTLLQFDASGSRTNLIL